MGRISREIEINAEPAAGFHYVADPRNAPNYISSIAAVDSGSRDDGVSPRPGDSWRARAQLLGAEHDIDLTLASLDPPRSVRYKITGDQQIDIMFMIEPSRGGASSWVTLDMEVANLPDMLLSAMLGNMLVGDLNRLKALLESRP